MQEIKVQFQPSGRTVYVLAGTPLLEAAERAGVILQTPCGGAGTCGKCRVQIDGQDELACQYPVTKPLVVDVPDQSLLVGGQQILVTDAGHAADATAVQPSVRVQTFALAPPAQGDVQADARRLLAALGQGICCSLDVLRTLPGLLRDQDWKGRAVLLEHQLLGILPDGPPEPPVLGVAFDVGTTTVVGTLIDLITGREQAVASRMNGQISLGDDVIARIQAVRETPAKRALLQARIVDTMNEILTDLSQQAGVRGEDIFELTVAGNATMQQMLLGLDCGALGEVPFVQAFDEALTCPAGALGVQAHSGASVYVFPQIGGFVGGDTVAGVLAARMDVQEGPVLFVDIGTNGEIVLAHKNRLYAASTAAGPAFEGARIRQGMRAVPGAIEKVLIGDQVVCNVIGNQPASGLCGTALIDTVAELLRIGILEESGLIAGPEDVPDGVPETIRARLRPDGDNWCFVLVDEQAAAGGTPVCLWQRDVRELQLASGAIRAGVQILLSRAGLAPDDLQHVLLAGAFGNYIRRQQARRIGLLPALPVERIRFVGNAASLGAKMALLSREARARASELAQRAEHVDVSMDPEFQLEFSMAMLFPGAEADGDLAAVDPD